MQPPGLSVKSLRCHKTLTVHGKAESSTNSLQVSSRTDWPLLNPSEAIARFSQSEGGIAKIRGPKAHRFDKAEGRKYRDGDWKELSQRQTERSLHPRTALQN